MENMMKKMTVKAEKKKVLKCFTCPICTNLFDSATTISECLHTFCRKCIHDKIVEENLKACPVCNVDLGVSPLDKLRADNSWDDMRLKLFPPKPKSVKAATKTNAAPLQSSRKKESSLSSLFESSLRVSSSPESSPDAPLEPDEKLVEQVEAVPMIQSSSRAVPKFRKFQRKNPKPRKNDKRLELDPSLKGSENDFHSLLNIDQQNGLAVSEGYIQKGDNSKKDNQEIPISFGDKKGTPAKRSYTAAVVKPETNQNVKENHDNVFSCGGHTEEVCGEKSEECVEVNNKRVLSSAEETEEVSVQVNKKKVFVGDTEEVSGEKLKNNGKENREHVLSSEKNCGEKPKGKRNSNLVLRPRRRKRMSSAGSTPEDDMEPETKVEGSNNPVWFSLIASEDQNTDRPLPQISPRYLRVNNGNLTVSYVKKYLVKKLSLKSENEVEIWLRHEPVCSKQRLHNLVDWWVHTTPISERESVVAGSSAAEFIMVLFYSRSHL